MTNEDIKELRRHRLQQTIDSTSRVDIEVRNILGLLNRLAETHKEYKQAIGIANTIYKSIELLKRHLDTYSVD